MLFPTVEFGIFFVIVYALYWLLRARPLARKLVLLAASYFFYGVWDWRFLFLLFGVTFVNYACSLALSAAKTPRGKKAWLAVAVAVNLGILGFFKYFILAATTANNLLLWLGLDALIPVLPIVLPVGISFFTFQGMSYTIDVYRGDLEVDRNLVDVLLFISFFPQLVAGPIVRGADFVPQLKRKDAGRPLETGRAFLLIAGGLFKKIVVANYLATLLVDPAFADPAKHSGLGALLGVYGYAFQIFCDFSAYSDMAIGFALLFGFRFCPNFDQPYRAASLQEFWRRWHISLSTWLRDYLYIPLGGNRDGKARTYRNLFLTMLLGGLWHGAAWTFAIWGALHGAGLCLERFARQAIRNAQDRREENGKTLFLVRFPFLKPVVQGFKTFLAFQFVCLTWIFFRSGSLESAFAYLGAIFAPWDLRGGVDPFVIALLSVGALMHFVPASLKDRARALFSGFHPLLQAATLGCMLLCVTLMAPEGVAPFIYFQF